MSLSLIIHCSKVNNSLGHTHTRGWVLKQELFIVVTLSANAGLGCITELLQANHNQSRDWQHVFRIPCKGINTSVVWGFQWNYSYIWLNRLLANDGMYYNWYCVSLKRPGKNVECLHSTLYLSLWTHFTGEVDWVVRVTKRQQLI